MNWNNLVPLVAPLSSMILLSTTAEQGIAAPPRSGDVVVEIKVSPAGRSLLPDNQFQDSPTHSYPSFNSQQLDRQLRLYSTYLEKFGTPDILIVGSSRALQGVDPVALQTALAQQGYPNLKVFNLGINGATAQVVNWLLQTLLTPEQLPKVIIWADGARAFNEGRVDHTFNKILASEGQKRLKSGVRPLPTASKGLQIGQLWSVKLLVRQNSLATDPSSQSLNSLNSLGLQVVDTRFNPTNYFRRFPRVSGDYDADYRNFSLAGSQANAFEATVRFAKARKISLVFVNLPLTSTYLDFSRRFYETQFQTKMNRLSSSKRFLFKNLAVYPQLGENYNFADPSHLNRFGAMAVSLQLSKELAPSLASIFQENRNQTSWIQSQSFGNRSRCRYPCLYFPFLQAG